MTGFGGLHQHSIPSLQLDADQQLFNSHQNLCMFRNLVRGMHQLLAVPIAQLSSLSICEQDGSSFRNTTVPCHMVLLHFGSSDAVTADMENMQQAWRLGCSLIHSGPTSTSSHFSNIGSLRAVHCQLRLRADKTATKLVVHGTQRCCYCLQHCQLYSLRESWPSVLTSLICLHLGTRSVQMVQNSQRQTMSARLLAVKHRAP